MSDADAFVYLDLAEQTHLVGRLWSHTHRGRQSATFEYDESWLQNSARFSLEPALGLGRGAFHTDANKSMFGAIGDSAPDRWGRVLMRRAERRRAELEQEQPRTLREIDYLLQVNDEARQGALRFAKREDGEFLANADRPIPPLVELPKLLGAVERISNEDSGVDEDLRLLLAPGSSLGGARPKASVRDTDGGLTIAKFPHKSDERNTVRWEAVALTLAAKAAIHVPNWRIETIDNKAVLLLDRFDRNGSTRLAFLSAMSMLGARDNEFHSYLELVEALRLHGAQPANDSRLLWRRMIFNVLISNTDDHLRNHGFLYSGSNGWVLSPAYDLNPIPVDVGPRVLSTAIDFEDSTASLELALSVCSYFELTLKNAQQIAGEVATAVRSWRSTASLLGISKSEIERMSSAFEHDDLDSAAAFAN